MMTMSRREKLLYHQIHPAKLATDFASSFITTWLFWNHTLWVGLAVAFVPSIIATLIIVSRSDLTGLRDSKLGRYVGYHVTRGAEATRFAGQFILWAGAWRHEPWKIAVGFTIILVGWTYSLPAWRRRAVKAD